MIGKKTKTEIRAFDTIVIRTPILPNQDCSYQNFLESDIIRYALWNASPELFERLKNGQLKEKNSLYKYYLRSIYRSTPFGLFASVSTGRLASSVQIELKAIQEAILFTRLDADFYIRLAEELIEGDKTAGAKKIAYFPNPTIYKIGSSFRYTSLKESTKWYEIKYSRFLDRLLHQIRQGACLEEIRMFFESLGYDEQNVKEYVNNLISENILIPNVERCLSSDSWEAIAPFFPIQQKMKELKDCLALSCGFINSSSLESTEKAGEKLIGILKPHTSACAFQIDMFRPAAVCQIGTEIVRKIKAVLPLFYSKKYFPGENTNLSYFIKEFSRLFGEQEIPLLRALDGEHGVKYPSEISLNVKNEFLPALVSYQTETYPSIQPFSAYLIRKSYQAARGGKEQFEIMDEELHDLDTDFTLCPPTFAVLCELLEQDEVYIKSIGGSTANNLISRFTMFPEIKKFSQQIASYEAQYTGVDKILAEIIYLPSNRESNIVNRESVYSHSICLTPCLSSSSELVELKDILVTIRNNRIKLIHGKTRKEIIPLLPTAHFYSKKGLLNYYSFLCEVQNSRRKCTFYSSYADTLSVLRYVPRIIYHGCILAKSTWILDETDFKNIDDFSQKMNDLHIPPEFVIQVDDNELYINREDPIGKSIFEAELRKRKELTICEYLHHTPRIQSKGKTYNNEVIISFFKK